MTIPSIQYNIIEYNQRNPEAQISFKEESTKSEIEIDGWSGGGCEKSESEELVA